LQGLCSKLGGLCRAVEVVLFAWVLSPDAVDAKWRGWYKKQQGGSLRARTFELTDKGKDGSTLISDMASFCSAISLESAEIKVKE
jgi:hypothetical protein